MPKIVTVVLVAALALFGVVAKKAIELILEREYEGWSRSLARLAVRVAGFVHRPKRDEWWADLCFMQEVVQQSGILPAFRCLLSAPLLAFMWALRGHPLATRFFIRDHLEEHPREWISQHPADVGVRLNVVLLLAGPPVFGLVHGLLATLAAALVYALPAGQHMSLAVSVAVGLAIGLWVACLSRPVFGICCGLANALIAEFAIGHGLPVGLAVGVSNGAFTILLVLKEGAQAIWTQRHPH
jgi:hypothetical protein